MQVEVALLSRSLVVQGDLDSSATLYGGHTMLHAGASGHITGVELRRMGQQNRLARCKEQCLPA